MANDDRYVMAKHAAVYPSAEELEAVQSLVSAVEGGLKYISDWLIDSTKASTLVSTEPAEPSSKLVLYHIFYIFYCNNFTLVI